MAKKKIIEEGADVTAVALIKPEFTAPVGFVLPDKEKHLETIKTKADEYAKLTIVDTTDKVGYDAVVKAMGEMKQTRLIFMAAAEENAVGPVKAALKKYQDDLAEIETALKDAEADLRKKKNFIDDEKVRLKAEAEAEKVRVMHLRVNDLNVLGAVFDGKVYTFPYSEMLMITAVDVKDYTDDEFNTFVAEVKEAWQTEQDRINDELNKKLLEEERQKKLAEDNAQAATELNLRRTKIRLKELKMLGYQQNDLEDCFSHGIVPLDISLKEVESCTDEIWDAMIYDVEHYEAPVVSEAVEEEENSTEPNNGDNSGAVGTRFTIRPASDFPSEDDEPDVEFDEPLPADLDVLMYFSVLSPYTDCDISEKLKMRVYPDQYAELALAAFDTIGNKGKFQELNWVIVPKT